MLIARLRDTQTPVQPFANLVAAFTWLQAQARPGQFEIVTAPRGA